MPTHKQIADSIDALNAEHRRALQEVHTAFETRMVDLRGQCAKLGHIVRYQTCAVCGWNPPLATDREVELSSLIGLNLACGQPPQHQR